MDSNKEICELNAVCKDCGTIMDSSYDHKKCKCGGVFHVDSARCITCSKRHPFGSVGKNCDCGGDIVTKMVSCPKCKGNSDINMLGEYCTTCNVLLTMEG